MSFLQDLKDSAVQAWAAVLPTMPFPKAPKGQQSLPGYRTQIEPRTSALTRTDRLLATTDRLTSRTLSDTYKTVLELSKSSPDLASAVTFLLRTGIPEGYTVVARGLDGQLDENGTGLAQELLRRLTFLGNPDGSFAQTYDVQTLSEMLGLEVILYGAMCGEVALDKARIPDQIRPISIQTIKFWDEDNTFRLTQRVAGTDIDLNFPTVILVTVDQVQTEMYPSSYVESAIQPLLTDIDFNNDLRRVLKRAVMPRLVATIDSDMVKKLCPPAILQDADKFRAYKQALIDEISGVLNNANPEDAIVTYNSVKYDFLSAQGADPSAIIQRVQDVLNGKLAAGSKTLPVILGHGVASNAASTESMLYVKQADMLRRKLNEFYSRALTCACRVMGQDVYVEFRYDDIDLRPAAELEAFFAMKQSRILMQLSLGLITDAEACVMLTGKMPPAGYKPLTGTMFMAPQQAAVNPSNPSSNTSTMGQTLDPGTPKQPKSQQGS